VRQRSEMQIDADGLRWRSLKIDQSLLGLLREMAKVELRREALVALAMSTMKPPVKKNLSIDRRF